MKILTNILLLSGVAALTISCSTVEEIKTPTYEWANQLNEKVQPIVESGSRVKSSLATPTASKPMDRRWVYGSPRNLTEPVASTPSKVKKNAKKVSSEPRTPAKNSTSNIVLNVNAGTAVHAENQGNDPTLTNNESRLEELYRGQYQKEASRELDQFGYSFFREVEKAIVSNGAVPIDYVLGAGDELELTISGSFDAFYSLKVDRNGFVSVPDIGPLAVAGKRFGEIEAHLRSFIGQRRSGFELSVNMGQLRQIQVSVLGRVATPGTVSVPALADVVSILSLVGGPTKDGTLRKIQVWRFGEEMTEVDLYSLLRGQDQSARKLQFQDGDTLCVPVIGSTIGIAGYVQQPGIYELKGPAVTLNEALELAGGLTPFSFTPQAHLEKTVDGRGREKTDVSLQKDGDSVLMKSGELLMVEAVEADRQTVVRIEGEVARAGDYQYRPGMRLSDLIGRADGLTIDAYLPQVFISRQIGETAVVEQVADRVGLETSRKVLVANLEKAIKGDKEHDLVLMPLDLVTVRSRRVAQSQAKVEIIGAVQRPGTYELTAGMRISDLVAIAGNPTAEVFYDEAELIRKYFDESTRRLDVKRYRFDLKQALSDSKQLHELHNPVLKNGDRLVIRSLQEAQVRVWIEGQVRFPGEYVFPAGSKITDLMSAAGGLLHDADLRAASFFRKSTQQLQSNRIRHLGERSRRLNEASFERMVQTGSASEGLAAKIALEQSLNTVGRMQSNEADGRIVIPFDRVDFPESNYNLELQNNDRLVIPRYEATVSVAGHVFRPVSLVAAEPISVGEAIEHAGGLTEFADKDLVYVLRADGRVDSVAQSPARLNKKTQLLAGDVLLIPRKAMERTMTAQISDVLGLVRELAEVGVIGAQLDNDIDMTLVRSIYDRMGSVDGNTLMEGVK